MLLVEHCARFVFKYLCQLLADFRLENAEARADTGLKSRAVVTVEQQLRGGVGLYNIAVHKVVIVLVEQGAERTPVAAVDERLLAGIEDARLAHGLKLVVDAAHHVDVGEVIQLKILADVELILKALRLDIGHEVPYLGFAGGGKRLKKNNFKHLIFHNISLSNVIIELFQAILSYRL